MINSIDAFYTINTIFQSENIEEIPNEIDSI